MPTDAWQIIAINHDCLAYQDTFHNWQFKLDNDYVATGYKSIGQHHQCSGLYFPSVSVPPGSKISGAYLIFRSICNRTKNASRTVFKIENTASPLPFSTLADFQARTYSIIIETHDYIYDNWQEHKLYSSPNIATMVQNVIDLPGWISGNPMSFFWGDFYGVSPASTEYDREAESFLSNPAEAVRLEITYTPPTPAPPPALPDPPTPPPPPRKGWALLDLLYEYIETGYKLTATTDVPCHLYCRMTTTPPRKHALPSGGRATFLLGDIRFCFVTYEDNEQEEPADTLIHTFLKPDWPVCETRYFYFVGSAYGDTSESETAIFKFHFLGPPPPPPTPIIQTYHPMADAIWTTLLISPLVPPQHWTKVEIAGDGWCVYNNVAILRSDGYKFTNPSTYLAGYIVDKLVYRLRWEALNATVWYKVLFYTADTTWEGPIQMTGITPYKWFEHTFANNPVTGLPWTYEQVQLLIAGLDIYDSGIPSGGACDAIELVVTWKLPP